MNELLKNAAAFTADKYGYNGKISFLGKGSYGEVYLVKGERKIAIKVSLSDLSREAEDLRILYENGVKVPKIAFFETQDGIGRLGMEYFEGINADGFRASIMPKEKRGKFAADVLAELEKIRGIKGKENETGDLREYYRKWAGEILDLAREEERLKRYYPVMKKLCEKFYEVFPEKTEVKFIHGDLCPSNMIMDQKSGRLVGIIDPLNARYADGDYEIFQLFCGNGERLGLYEKYCEKYCENEENREKLDVRTAFYLLFAEAELCVKEGILLEKVLKKAEKRIRRVESRFF